jgi:peroxiredoxin family protein
MFFTFWGLDMVNKEKMTKLKCTPLGNPSMAMPNGMGIPNLVGALPGMTGMASSMMRKEIEALDFPPVDEFLEMIHDAGGKMYGCRMAMDMMKLEKEDLFDGIDDVIGAMEFMEMSEGAQVLFI